MAQKTQVLDGQLEPHLAGLPAAQRGDADALIALMTRVTGAEARLWSGNMIGFGDYHYAYKSGHTGHAFDLGFAVRKTGLTLYLWSDLPNHAWNGLGKYKRGKSCVYIKRLADIDLAVLERLLRHSLVALEPMRTQLQTTST